MKEQNPTTILRLPSVLHITGLSRTTIYAMMAVGTFSDPIKLGMFQRLPRRSGS
ncbi:helix-turn-helix transcriptional regulator [Pontibaca salina]|uniref:AlpA family phage regulatory protein n=1 Tax=Pontibaca salina TaxID=2795731 RepID=A0A934HLK9_9RHOB|nr:AlpA family phage regulatory protein [Pontibaca salina]MBI6630454.1 AlpA family phage regulatory protein [Pontibaca salina]